MKTVLFIEHTKTLFEQVEPGHGYNPLDVREYVLASEANEQDNWNIKKQKELELEQIKDNERIKVLDETNTKLCNDFITLIFLTRAVR